MNVPSPILLVKIMSRENKKNIFSLAGYAIVPPEVFCEAKYARILLSVGNIDKRLHCYAVFIATNSTKLVSILASYWRVCRYEQGFIHRARSRSAGSHQCSLHGLRKAAVKLCRNLAMTASVINSALVMTGTTVVVGLNLAAMASMSLDLVRRISCDDMKGRLLQLLSEPTRWYRHQTRPDAHSHPGSSVPPCDRLRVWTAHPSSSSQRRHTLKNRQAESCNFLRQTRQISNGIPTDGCKFPTEEIMGAQNFNFPINLPKMAN